MEPIGCPEMSVSNYHYLLCNNPDECSSDLCFLLGNSLASEFYMHWHIKLPRRKHTTFRTWRKFEIENSSDLLCGGSLESRVFSVVCLGVHCQLLCKFWVTTATLKTVCMLIKSGLGSFLQFGQYISYDILDMLAVVYHYASICLLVWVYLSQIPMLLKC
jgi:hypothetical protein